MGSGVYYNDYSFPGNPYTSSASNVSSQAIGLLTGSKVRNLITGGMLWTVRYYDDYFRLRETV